MKYLGIITFFLIAGVFVLNKTFEINANSDFDPNKPIISPAPDPDRYSPGRTLSPVVGSHQAFDNEAALQASQTSLNFDKAETELFKQDKQTATNFFNEQKAQYEQTADKQADTYKVDAAGTGRLRDSATTFRDFHSARATIMNEHLTIFPTEKKMYEGCRQRMAPYENDNSIYDIAMEETRKHYDDEFDEYPESTGDRCQAVIDNNRDYIIKNDHVPQELEVVIGDSVAVVDGMTEVLEILDDPNRDTAEKFKLISDNPAWGLLDERRVALEKCEQENCLEASSRLLRDLTDYPSSANYGGQFLSQGNRDLINAINGRKFDKSYFDLLSANSGNFSKFKAYAQIKLNNASSIDRSSQTASLSGHGGVGGPIDNKAKQAVENDLKGDAQSQLKLNQATYKKTKGQSSSSSSSRTSDGSVRGSDGVLRTKSGKAVQGFEGPVEADIFKIISSRYQKKYFIDLDTKNESK